MNKYIGLTSNQVEKRKKEGKLNVSPKPIVKSNMAIIASHVFNIYNAYIFSIALALFLVKSYTSLFFVIIVSMNIIIRASQEIKSKNMISKLNLIIQPKTKVIRDGELISIDNEEIVLDEIIYFETGNQISTDSIVLDESVEVDESLISGESLPVVKHVGDHLLSGSFIVSGSTHAKAEHVGSDNYATKLTNEARKAKPFSSELIKTFTKVTKITGYFIIPIATILISQSYILRGQSITSTIVNTATALLGMLPNGLILLTSVALAASVIKLGFKGVLVQQMFSIETLSKVDVLCLDKTGTLTEGKMSVQDISPISSSFPYDINEVMQSFIYGSTDNNITFQTLKKHFGANEHYKTKNRVPFSSMRKWSAVELDKVGTIIVGAPEFILPDLKLNKKTEKQKREGSRILLVAHLKNFDDLENNITAATPITTITIADPIRADASKTLSFFEANNVAIKVISGDNPITISSIAKQAGIKNADKYIDASKITTNEELEDAILNYNVIGRTSPYQKHEMILCLQRHNQKVAMTGDGVNDVLALKEADVSIAMGSGSDAAKQVSKFVLIDERLETLVEIVKEGRLNINNITRSASMYYLKTIYTILLALACIVLNIPYPFIPFQVTVIDLFIGGVPSFMIMFETNTNKPKESIGRHALRFALPNAVAIAFAVITIRLLTPFLDLNIDQMFTVLYFTTAFISLQLIYRIYKPLNLYRSCVFIADMIAFVVTTIILRSLLNIQHIDQYMLTIIVCSIAASIAMVTISSTIINRYLDRRPINT